MHWFSTFRPFYLLTDSSLVIGHFGDSRKPASPQIGSRLVSAICFFGFGAEHAYDNTPEMLRLLPIDVPVPSFHFAAHERGNLFGQKVGAA
jgi:hypothetical protein